MADGRFAPSPTGDLHLGNLRTALLAWLFARSSGGRHLLRFEDLDPTAVRPEHYRSQLRDLTALGLDWDEPPLRQRDRIESHRDAIADLRRAGLTYPCWCSRREIREAALAPHGAPGTYPGTCLGLTRSQQAERSSSGRKGALRLRAESVEVTITDRLRGELTGRVDDFVLQRGDGTPAYNLVVVVDDHHQGVEEVVRADDLLPSTPRHAHLHDLLGLPRPAWAHVPLVVARDGVRLAKRDGAVTMQDRLALGDTPARVCGRLGESLGLSEPGESVVPADLLDRFDPDRLPSRPWRLTDHELTEPW